MKLSNPFFFLYILICTFFFSLHIEASSQLFLKNKLGKAIPGDFIVISQNKAYTLFHIYDKTSERLTIEEITIPENKTKLKLISWDDWVASGAPGNTSWIVYTIDLSSGKMGGLYSFTRNCWEELPEAEQFLSTLLNMKFTKIEERDRKRIGPAPELPSYDRRPFWQPHMVMNGQVIEGVRFNGWKTFWPKDGSELAGKSIEIYLPEDDDSYPSYFPYWLQVSGKIGKAKIRIIDSGTGLFSPRAKSFFSAGYQQ